MRIINQIIYILGVYFIAELLALIIFIPISPSILAMIIMFIVVKTKIIKVHQIEKCTNFMLSNLALFVILTAVGIIDSKAVLENNFFKFLLIIIIASIVTFVATGYSVMIVVKIIKKRSEKNG